MKDHNSHFYKSISFAKQSQMVDWADWNGRPTQNPPTTKSYLRWSMKIITQEDIFLSSDPTVSLWLINGRCRSGGVFVKPQVLTKKYEPLLNLCHRQQLQRNNPVDYCWALSIKHRVSWYAQRVKELIFTHRYKTTQTSIATTGWCGAWPMVIQEKQNPDSSTSWLAWSPHVNKYQHYFLQ